MKCYFVLIKYFIRTKNLSTAKYSPISIKERIFGCAPTTNLVDRIIIVITIPHKITCIKKVEILGALIDDIGIV